MITDVRTLDDWLTDATRFADLVSAVAAHDWATPPSRTVGTASGAVVPLARLALELRRREDALSDRQWDVLDTVGFAWSAPERPRPSAPIDVVAARVANGTATLEEVMRLQRSNPDADVFSAWVQYGTQAALSSGANLVALLGDPEFTVEHVDASFALGQWVRQLSRAEAYGRVSEVVWALPARGRVLYSLRTLRTLRNFGLVHEHSILCGSAGIPVPYFVRVADGSTFDLGTWLRRQRNLDRRGRLSTKMATAVSAYADLPQPGRSDALSQFILDALDDYRRAHGHADPPQSVKVTLRNGQSFAIGKWLANRRLEYRNGVLDPALRDELERRGVTWNPHRDRLGQWVALFRQYVEREGHGRTPKHHLERRPDGTMAALGIWVHDMRTRIRLGQYPEEFVQDLVGLGFVATPTADTRELQVYALGRFVAREGHGRVPATHVETLPDGTTYPLGRAVMTLRGQRKAGTLRPERIAALDAAGFVWDPFAQRFAYRFGFLEQYVDREGHADVPSDHIETRPTGETLNLGQWVADRRRKFATTGMLPAEAERFYALGCEWADPTKNPALTNPTLSRPKRSGVIEPPTR